MHKILKVLFEVLLLYAENIIATLEEKPSKSGPQGSVRVYINWEADLSQRPMRARIAGTTVPFISQFLA